MKSIIRTIAMLLALATIAAACGSGDEDGLNGDLDDGVLSQSADQATRTAESADAADGAVEAAGDEPQLLAVGTSAEDGTAAVQGSADPVEPETSATDGPTATAPGEVSTSSTTAALRVTTSDASQTTVETSSGRAAATTSSDQTTSRPPSSPASSTTRPPTTTTAAPTTQQASTTSGGGSGSGYFATLPVGASLPSGSSCAARVKSAPEIRPGNASYNQTRGTNSHEIYPRVDGNFVGTTDEIIQWAACKWGIDEDIARAQTAKESWWDMTAGGDRTSDQSRCHPDLRTGSGQCPESIGVLQVRFRHHSEAFEDSNAIRSTAYNVDYTYAVWRDCYDGGSGWLNTVERGRQYAAGDLDGCLGVWFSGRWYTDRAITYIGEVKELARNRIWEQSQFRN